MPGFVFLDMSCLVLNMPKAGTEPENESTRSQWWWKVDARVTRIRTEVTMANILLDLITKVKNVYSAGYVRLGIETLHRIGRKYQ